MEIRCPACSARYTTDAAKLRGKTARMRCKACQTAWVISGPGESAPAEKRAAVVKRGAEREQRDLFAPPESRPAPASDSPPPSYGMNSTGARSENSVLF